MMMSRCKLPLLLLPMLAMLTAPYLSKARADVWADVDGTDVSLFHTDARYNCCWVLDVNLDFGAGVIDLWEIEGEGGDTCYCFCDFDLRFDFSVPEPGDYLLNVWYFVTEEYPNHYELVSTLPITITAGGILAATVDQSDCGGWATGIPSPPTPSPDPSFSAIKSRY